MRTLRLAVPLLLMAVAAQGAGAQTFRISAGPAMRIFDRQTPYEVSGVNGMAFDAALAFPVAPKLQVLVGAGMVMRTNPNVYAPLPPGSPPCDCEASETLAQGRVGVAYDLGRFTLGAGGVLADGGDDAPARFGGFGEVRMRPLRALPFLDVGVLAFHLTASTGAHRALVLPTIGLRF